MSTAIKTKKESPPPKPEFKPPKSPHFIDTSNAIKAYLIQKGRTPTEWCIVELTIQNNQIIHVNKDNESLKEIKVRKLLDMLAMGTPLYGLA